MIYPVTVYSGLKEEKKREKREEQKEKKKREEVKKRLAIYSKQYPTTHTQQSLCFCSDLVKF
jgi:hypothetical protein